MTRGHTSSDAPSTGPLVLQIRECVGLFAAGGVVLGLPTWISYDDGHLGHVADVGGLELAQRISGAYRLITIPSIHKMLMFSLGADKAITRYVDDVLQPKADMKILDVGCGPANILLYLPPVDYTGIDLNEKHIAYARQRHGDRGRFIVGNAADDLRQEERTFDLINVSALLHHLGDDEAVSLFTSLKRLLKANGRIVTIDNVWLPRQRAAVRLINRLDSRTNIRTPEGYLGLLSDLGFDLQTRVFNDQLRIPYDHIIMIARNARQGNDPAAA